MSYYNGGNYTFTWSQGRDLLRCDHDGRTISYSYDMNGLRRAKSFSGRSSTYLYAGGRLVREIRNDQPMNFFYDQAGQPYALTYNGSTYYYILNLQGDVMALRNAAGEVVASYTYGPYGEILTATGSMAAANPLRYRGYYYDSETRLYYLQSRYYDPAIGRFLNADTYTTTGQGLLGYKM